MLLYFNLSHVFRHILDYLIKKDTLMQTRFAHSPAALNILKSILNQKNPRNSSKLIQNVFLRGCNCEYDWMNAFCLRYSQYKLMKPMDAPSLCICR